MSPEKGPDLLDSFNLKRDQLEKFKESPLDAKAHAPEVAPPTSPHPKTAAEPAEKEKKAERTPVRTSSKTKKTKSKSNRKISESGGAKQDKLPSERSVPSPEAVLERSKASSTGDEGVSYPADYPQQLKDYDVNSLKVWEKFRPLIIPGEAYYFKIKYFGVVCGTIYLETLPLTRIGGKTTFHMRAHLKSAPFYSYLYTLDDYIETFVEERNFLPVKFQLVQKESKQSVNDLQLFDRENFKTYSWYERVKNGEASKSEESAVIPHWIQDSYSVLHFVRGLPLKEGDYYEFPVVTRAKLWIIKARVVGKEMVSLDNKVVEGIKLKAVTEYPGILEKRGDINFWYSADQNHKLLKFSAKVKIGTLDGELTEAPVDEK